jgi:5-methylthioadenosine/S-adenosylhomocysteine deaminase
MIEQMKFVALLQNVTNEDPTLITAERAIEMATINNATAMGIDGLVGSLEAGKRADIAVFDLGKAHTSVLNRPVAGLVFSAHGTDVDTVVINGQVRLRDGELVGFDREHEVLDEARRRAHDVLVRANLARRTFVDWRPTAAPAVVAD